MLMIAALFAGSRTVIELWTMHIRGLCQEEAANDPVGFDAELATQRTIFIRRMHVYTGESGPTVDKTYRISGKKIEVSRYYYPRHGLEENVNVTC